MCTLLRLLAWASPHRPVACVTPRQCALCSRRAHPVRVVAWRWPPGVPTKHVSNHEPLWPWWWRCVFPVPHPPAEQVRQLVQPARPVQLSVWIRALTATITTSAAPPPRCSLPAAPPIVSCALRWSRHSTPAPSRCDATPASGSVAALVYTCVGVPHPLLPMPTSPQTRVITPACVCAQLWQGSVLAAADV